MDYENDHNVLGLEPEVVHSVPVGLGLSSVQTPPQPCFERGAPGVQPAEERGRRVGEV